jgi:hypothetical protein
MVEARAGRRINSHLATSFLDILGDPNVPPLRPRKSIKVVVCVDIDYKQSQRATLSVWRPEYVKVEGKEYFQTTADVDAQVCFRSQVLTSCDLTIKQAFRTDDGIPVEDTVLRLSLRDFATDSLLEEYADINQGVVITAQQLCAFLQSAEAR